MRWLGLLAFAAGCGRIGFGDDRSGLDAEPQPQPQPVSQADCPAGFTFVAASCYLLGSAELPWLDGEAACEASGGHLVVFDDAAEVQTVRQFAAGQVSVDHWVGLSDRVTADEFVAVTGGVPEYLLWSAGEPNQSGDCVIIKSTAELDTGDCALPDDIICEFDGRPARPGVAF